MKNYLFLILAAQSLGAMDNHDVRQFIGQAQRGDIAYLEAALAHSPALINTTDPETGFTALHAALWHYDARTAAFLIERGAGVYTKTLARKTARHFLAKHNAYCYRQGTLDCRNERCTRAWPKEFLALINGECVICLNTIEEIGHVYDCGHVVHKTCVHPSHECTVCLRPDRHKSDVPVEKEKSDDLKDLSEPNEPAPVAASAAAPALDPAPVVEAESIIPADAPIPDPIASAPTPASPSCNAVAAAAEPIAKESSDYKGTIYGDYCPRSPFTPRSAKREREREASVVSEYCPRSPSIPRAAAATATAPAPASLPAKCESEPCGQGFQFDSPPRPLRPNSPYTVPPTPVPAQAARIVLGGGLPRVLDNGHWRSVTPEEARIIEVTPKPVPGGLPQTFENGRWRPATPEETRIIAAASSAPAPVPVPVFAATTSGIAPLSPIMQRLRVFSDTRRLAREAQTSAASPVPVSVPIPAPIPAPVVAPGAAAPAPASDSRQIVGWRWYSEAYIPIYALTPAEQASIRETFEACRNGGNNK